jgi:hypothetical protein
MEKKIIIFLLLLYFIAHNSHGQLSTTSIQGITNEFGSDVVTKIIEESGNTVGTITYLSRGSKKVKARFFAYNPSNSISAYQRFLEWKKDKKVILLTSAGFSESLNNPICKGFCVEEGAGIGPSVDNDLDALVFIYGYDADAGGVVIVDLDRNFGEMTLNKVVYRPRLQPSTFYSACIDAGAFAFQTQLFYFKDVPRFSWSAASSSTNSRRFFAVLRKDGIVNHAVIHLPGNFTLTEYAEKAYQLLKRQGYEVIGLLNFDTGAYDFFRLYYNNSRNYYSSLLGNNGKVISLIGGQDDKINSATNFIVYYYE